MSVDELGREAGRDLTRASGSLMPPTLTAIRATRRRRRGIAAGLSALLGAGVLAVASLLGTTGSELSGVATTTPGTTTPPPPEMEGVFIPPSVTRDGLTEVTLTLLDGSLITLAYPSELDLTSGGFTSQTAGGPGESQSAQRSVVVRHGALAGSVEQLEQGWGPATRVQVLREDGAERVERWEFGAPDPEIAYILFEFDGWTVAVWDGVPGGPNPRMTEDDQQQWADQLSGTVSHDGFLVLSARPPLRLVSTWDERGGPDGPDGRIDGASGGLGIFLNDCDRITRLDEETYEPPVFAWCDTATNTLLFGFGGDAETNERLHQTLEIRRLEVPGVGVVVPEQPTGARWFADGIGASGGTNLIGRGSLVLRGGPYVFVADGGGTVTALQTATGEPSWQQTLDGGNVVLLGVSSDSVLVGGYGVVTALDHATGAERWRSVDPDGLLWPMAAYSGRHGIHVLLDRPTEGDRDPPEVVTFNPVDGSVIWSRPLDGVDHPDLDIQTGPASSALVGDRLFVKTTGAMHAIDARSGEILWIHRFAAVPVESFWPAPLLVDGDLLYVPDPNGELVALEAASGRQRWRLEVGPGFVAPVSIEGGLVVFVDGGGVHAVEAATGDRVWDHPMTRAQAAVVGDVVVVLGRRRLTGLDAATGNAVWSASVNFDIPYAVLAVGDVAVAAAEDGVVAVVAETGAILWELGRGAAEPPIVVDDEILIAHSDGRRTIAVYPMRPAE